MTALRFLPLVLVATSCSPGPAPFVDADRAAAAEEVHSASTALVEAMNRHEPEAVLAHYDLSGDFVYVGCTNVLGGDLFGNVIRAYHVQNPDAQLQEEVTSIRVLGPDAAVVSLRGVSADSLDLFTTRVLRRGDDGRWQVVHEHESWPGCAAPRSMHPGTTPGDSLAMEPIGDAS